MPSVALESEIKRRWMKLAELDAQGYAAKAAEYGSMDLEIMGEALRISGSIIGPRGNGEMGAIMFYALGKVARALSGLREGRNPSADTLKDLVVYGMMARFLLEDINGE